MGKKSDKYREQKKQAKARRAAEFARDKQVEARRTPLPIRYRLVPGAMVLPSILGALGSAHESGK